MANGWSHPLKRSHRKKEIFCAFVLIKGRYNDKKK